MFTLWSRTHCMRVSGQTVRSCKVKHDWRCNVTVISRFYCDPCFYLSFVFFFLVFVRFSLIRTSLDLPVLYSTIFRFFHRVSYIVMSSFIIRFRYFLTRALNPPTPALPTPTSPTTSPPTPTLPTPTLPHHGHLNIPGPRHIRACRRARARAR